MALPVVSLHSLNGLTDICYTKDGSHFLTCGQDGIIHIFNTTTNNHLKDILCVDQCHCLIVYEDRIFVGTNRNDVEVRSYPHGDSLPSLVHFAQPVSTFCLSNSTLFVGTKDYQVVMMNLNDKSNEKKYFHGHQAPILSLNVYEDKRWLATSCCDGVIRIFNIDKQILIKQLDLLQKSTDIETALSLVKIDWDKSDHMLAVPMKNMVEFFESEKWTRKKTYENDSIKESVNLIRYSPCGTVFIVAYTNGQLSIVNRLTLEICMNYSSKYAVCSLVWNPIEPNRFICVTKAGEYADIRVNALKRTLSDENPSDDEGKQSVVKKKTTDVMEKSEDFKNVHVDVGRSKITYFTVSSYPFNACLFYIIDGNYKGRSFAYFYHSNYSYSTDENILSIFQKLLQKFTRELKLGLFDNFKENIMIKNINDIRMFMGGGTTSTRDNERKAMSVLLNPKDLLYKYLDLFAGEEWVMLFYKLVNHTVIIKPVCFESTLDEDDEDDQVSEDKLIGIHPPFVNITYNCLKKEGKLHVAWDDDDGDHDDDDIKQVVIAQMDFNLLFSDEKHFTWNILKDKIKEKTKEFNDNDLKTVKKCVELIPTDSFYKDFFINYCFLHF